MKYININTNSVVPKLPRLPNTLNTNWSNSKQVYKDLGWRILIKEDVPDGYSVVSKSYEQQDEDTFIEVLVTDTIANIQHKEFLKKVELYQEDVMTLSNLLSVFGLSFPTTEKKASKAIYPMCKADVNLTADGTMSLAVYKGLLDHITNEDIVEIYEYLTTTP